MPKRLTLKHLPAIDLYELTITHSEALATKHMLTIEDVADLFDDIVTEVVRVFRSTSG